MKNKLQKKENLSNSNKRWWLYNDNNHITKPWFSFLEWIFLTGALAYLNEKTNNRWVEFFYITSFGFLYLFVHSRVGECINLVLNVAERFVKNKKLKVFLNILSAIISVILLSWIYIMLNEIIAELQVQPL